jgi:hypothetical protein
MRCKLAKFKIQREGGRRLQPIAGYNLGKIITRDIYLYHLVHHTSLTWTVTSFVTSAQRRAENGNSFALLLDSVI